MFEVDEIKAEEREIKVESIAKDIIVLARNTLLVNFRFLDRAISNVEFIPDNNISIATDGEFIYYGPWYILSIYKEDQSRVARDILHAVMHCVFRHNFIGKNIDRIRWDLAADIAVENAIRDMNSRSVYAARAGRQAGTIEMLKAEVGTLTAEKIYKWLGDRDFSEDELEKQREDFIADGHGIWYGGGDANAKRDEKINLRKIWEDVSRRMQTELETMQQDKDSALVQNLKSLNRTKHSYTDFLKRFGVHGELLQISDEEFDNNYYTYGLKLYGNIPLIEPLEYSEQKRIKEFVIAIDTSGSVRGDVVQSFIQHTYDILRRHENFFTRVNMYIIQCDDRIEDVTHIECIDDFEKYLASMEIKGLGKTDFRPVFSYVDELIRTKQLKELQGLIYFTDGQGTFPAEKPKYDTAFILHRGDYEEPPVPIWAQHMTVTEEDILDKRFSAC